MNQVSAADDAKVREACDEDLIDACTEELLAQPEAAPSEAPAEWWPNPGEDPLGEFSHVTVSYRGVDLYTPGVDAVEVRKRIGMVFQKPNPFPKSIYDNVAFGPRVLGLKGDMDEIVERTLRRAALWDEVKDRLHTNAFGLSGGQQQRLVIARCLAVDPDVLLMDEPASALDPISTARIEDLMQELVLEVTIVIVTHNLQQAGRVSHFTAFLTVEPEPNGGTLAGHLVEFGPTEKLFKRPEDPRTEAYLSGKFG